MDYYFREYLLRGLLVAIGIIVGLLTLNSIADYRERLEEAKPVYVKLLEITERRANDKHCQSGNQYEQLCQEMYDEIIRDLIKNDHVGGH